MTPEPGVLMSGGTPPNFSRWRRPAATASQPRRRAQSSCGGGSAPSGAGTRVSRPRGPGRAPRFLPYRRRLSAAAKSNAAAARAAARAAAAAAATTAAQLGARRSRMLSSALTPPRWPPRAATSLHLPGPAPSRPAPPPASAPHHAPFPSRDTARGRAWVSAADWAPSAEAVTWTLAVMSSFRGHPASGCSF